MPIENDYLVNKQKQEQAKLKQEQLNQEAIRRQKLADIEKAKQKDLINKNVAAVKPTITTPSRTKPVTDLVKKPTITSPPKQEYKVVQKPLDKNKVIKEQLYPTKRPDTTTKPLAPASPTVKKLPFVDADKGKAPKVHTMPGVNAQHEFINPGKTVQAPVVHEPVVRKLVQQKPVSPVRKQVEQKAPIQQRKPDVGVNPEQLERFIQVTTANAVDDEIARYGQGIHQHIDRQLSPEYPKRRMTIDGYPYAYPMPYHGGVHPGYGGYGNPYVGHHGYGGYGHPGYGHGGLYGGHHGYAPHMMPYDPRAFPPYEERRKTKTANDPGHRFSSPQHGQKKGQKNDFRF